MHPVQAIVPLAPGTLGCPPIQTGPELASALRGEPEGVAKTALHIATRTGLFALAMSFFEKDKKKLLKQSLGGSLAVEAFVLSWNWASHGEPLPSGEVACDFVQGKTDSFLGVLSTVAFRTAIIGTGIYLGGEHRPKELAKKSVASVAALEATILANAYRNHPETTK